LAGQVAGDVERRELLEQACRAADQLAELQAEVRSLGPVVTGSRGQPVRNPLVDQVAVLQGVYSRLLRKLTIARAEPPRLPLIEAPARLARFDPADWPGLPEREARDACYRARLEFVWSAEGPTTLGDLVDVLRLQMSERGDCFPGGQPRPVPWEWYLPSAEEYRANQRLSRERVTRAWALRDRAGWERRWVDGAG
jgi:hypothetical protein